MGGLAYGAIRGQQTQWREPVAFAALGIGALALVAFPILMARRKHPLVPLSLFRIRAFSTINLSTLLIYGALYASAGFQALALPVLAIQRGEQQRRRWFQRRRNRRERRRHVRQDQELIGHRC